MRNPWFKPTKPQVETMAQGFPLVRTAKVVDERLYGFTLAVRLKWWSWLFLGIGHYWVWRALVRSRKLWTAAGVVGKVRVR